MLKPEYAREELKKLKIEDWYEKRKAAITQLGKPLEQIAESIRSHHRRYRDETTQDFDHRLESIQKLEALPSSERQKFFTALIPKLGVYIEGAWQLRQHLPYQIGYTRKAFRAPHDPNVVRHIRSEWLRQLFNVISDYDQDVTWFAAWSPYLGGYADALGILFAAAIDSKTDEGQKVFDVLVESANGTHEIGAMGRHVTRALLAASRPEGWDFVEKLLLAAQRQEGLRQTILETIDESHPIAFQRMLRLILDHDLIRFSATIRAVSVWFGFDIDVSYARNMKTLIERTLYYLGDAAARAEAIRHASAEETYLALWSAAFEDAASAVEAASPLLNDANADRRFVAAHLLVQLNLDSSRRALFPALDDPDPRVSACALLHLQHAAHDFSGTDLFERLERLLPRYPPKPKTFSASVWKWMSLTVSQSDVANALKNCVGTRPLKRLIPYIPLMMPGGRSHLVHVLKEKKVWDEATREVFFILVGDATHWVREEALKVVAEHDITQEEAQRVEGLLTRVASDLRRGVYTVLIKRNDDQVLASIDRLLKSTSAEQRLGGLELIRQLKETNRVVDQCRAHAEGYRAARKKISKEENDLLDSILRREEKPAMLDDALGLLDPAKRTTGTPPRLHPERKPFITPAAMACLKSLDELIHEHRNMEIVGSLWDERAKEVLLGNAQWLFPKPDLKIKVEEDIQRLPLRELWQTWEAKRDHKWRDKDSLELIRAWATVRDDKHIYLKNQPKWITDVITDVFCEKLIPINYPTILSRILDWLIRLTAPDAADFILDAAEHTLALVPREQFTFKPEGDQKHFYGDWRDNRFVEGWITHARMFCRLCPQRWTNDHVVRFWRLLRWLDQPNEIAPRHRPHLDEVIAAFRAGAAAEDDLFDHLLGTRVPKQERRFRDLYLLTARKKKDAESFGEVQGLVDRCRARILEVELNRGEMPTAASAPALELRSSGSLNELIRILEAMGDERFIRGWSYDSLSKAAVLSHLVRVTFPAETDTPELFAARAKAASLSTPRLIDLAVYAPQWARHVEHTIRWNDLADGVWWIHAHTKDSQWRVDQEIREAWNAEVSERTPLSSDDLIEGAVDAAWFQRVYGSLKKTKWDELYESAEFASGGSGHARARLFADAMLGKVKTGDLIKRIRKRHQDSVRALGLIALPSGAKREKEILNRYQVIQEFLRGTKQFGSQRQASEKLAARIALENLARTANYPDPVQLEWAMEAREIADMKDGTKIVNVDGAEIALAINDLGEIALSVIKNDKPLKAIPPAIKKNPKVVELLERKSKLEKQTSRMRRSLEEAMCRGIAFAPGDLQTMFTHPVLAPMLGNVIFIGDGMMGYATKRGKGLLRPDGDIIPLKKKDKLRIAHPYDLFRSKEWHVWQKECFQRERIQPFKQIYRELYLLTANEKEDNVIARRYAGHQVNPRQTVSLLTSRGWVVRHEEGASRTFHFENITTYLEVMGLTFSPVDVEGVTVEGVTFYKRGERLPMKLTDVPPRVFSEVMRDVDLVVSVAHVGGVDPEASTSTVEMRANLIKETCALLKIKNVKLQKSHALIEGHLGSYSVHLGSATVHRQPGGAVCIVPVPGQHRGRLFLPFVDDDPKTAEITSKVILLAKDNEIKDPTILEQILGK